MGKFVGLDKYPLDISKAYVHKTFIGGIFSILYCCLWLYLAAMMIARYIQSPYILNSHIISGIDQQFSKPSYEEVSVRSKIYIQNKGINEIKDFFSYFKFIFLYKKKGIDNPRAQIYSCDFNDDSSCVIDLPLKDDYFQVDNDDYPSINVFSCYSLDVIKAKGIINIEQGESLLADCNKKVDEVYEKDYIKNKFKIEMTMPFNSLSSTYEVNKIDKLYEAFFVVAKQKVDKYVFEQIKLQLVRNNQYLPGTTNKTYINWRYPDKDSSSLSFTDEYHFSAVFSSRNGDIIYYYEVKRTSFLNILINLGGILKFVGLLLYIPNIWNKYFRQKALLTLNFFFDRDSISMESDNKLLPDENDKEEKLTVKHSQIVDWKKLTFTQWVCARFCCCFSSTYKLIKNERKKTLKELESASFIRFGFDGKWVDIRSYMPGYIAK